MEEDGNNGRGDSVGGVGIKSEDEAGRPSPLLLVAPVSTEDEAAAITSSSTLPISSLSAAPLLTANLAEEAAVPSSPLSASCTAAASLLTANSVEEAAVPSSPLPASFSVVAPLLGAGLLGIPRSDPSISAVAPLLTAGLLGVPRDDPSCAAWDWAVLVHLMPVVQVSGQGGVGMCSGS